MGKPRDTKVAILPSTTRKGTTLSTSAALDSPSVIIQLVSPPQTSRVGISAESENSSDNFDDASTVLDNAGSLGPFLDATIARSRQIEITETPNENTVTPVNSPEIDDLDEDYVELDDDFIDKCNATTSTSLRVPRPALNSSGGAPPPTSARCFFSSPTFDLPSHTTTPATAVGLRRKCTLLPPARYASATLADLAQYGTPAGHAPEKRTPDEAEELLAKISKNHDEWSTPEPTPTPILKKRGMIELNDEDMREAKKSLMEKGIKSEDVKSLPPIEDLCKIISPSSTIEDPLYPEGHPKRIEQDSQRTKEISSPSKKKKKKHKTVVESSEPVNDPNSISISDAETESGNEHDEDNDKNDAPDKEEIEKEPEKHDKNKKYTKEDFITKKHGAVIDCNKGKVTFNVDDKEHTVYFPKRIDKRRKMNNYNFGEVFEGETTSTGRPSRASTRIRRSYNEDVIAPSFDEGNGDPNASSFPCYEFLSNAGLLDDFLTLIGKAGLTTYMEDERKQYYMLTKIFVESFKFNNKHFNPTVAFKIYGTPVTMKLKDFCVALGIAPAGTAKKIEDNPRVLLELYREITNDDCRTIQRGKIRNIQLPAIKYFVYYLATSILGRENTSNISSYHLAFLIAALTGETPYHLGSVIARRLSNKGPIYGGIIASRILARLDLPLDPTDVEIPPVKLDIAAMKSHQFVTVDSSMDNIVYRMLFADGDEREVLLPQTDLFSIDRKPWSRSKEEVDEKLKIQGFHQQHDSEDAEPSYDYTVTYPVASSSTYPEPGRSSSYYGDTTSWGPWE
ncbi:hypothetical protein QYE76_012132 [Lolium multiflorum]|uniref:Arabidopsis retrotransposon Orf1 C-terminal domain-containing protein n=1 Tax=Lolium multiflorum TaxID=4521 RepID=A0AAD8X4N4_LOLMU|nr:hypothetical protein QYE76_012132 [Lolium multiflorum]